MLIAGQKETFSSFLFKVLNGATLAIVVALIPNAILATFLKPLTHIAICEEILQALIVFQFLTPLLIGILSAYQFKLSPLVTAVVGGASFVASGAWRYLPVVVLGQKQVALFAFNGIGDVINCILTTALAIIVGDLLFKRLQSLALVALPIVVGIGVGFLGYKFLFFTTYITTFIGGIINSFTTLHPFLMTILIAMSFSLIIISPLSTVAIGLAIGLDGLASAAAGMGVASCAIYLVYSSFKQNKPGITLAILLGAMKMMMVNFLKHPIMGLGASLVAGLSSLSVVYLGLQGTPQSAGFGLVGLVSPLASLTKGNLNIALMVFAWFVLPLLVTIVVDYLLVDILHLYKRNIFIINN